jgi:hypothetical protein
MELAINYLVKLHNYVPGHAVALLVEALRYNSEGRGFDSLWCHCNFHWYNPSGRTVAPGVDSVSNRNEYQEYFFGGKDGRCVGLTTLPPSCTDCLEIWEPQPPETLRVCPGVYRDCFTFTLTYRAGKRVKSTHRMYIRPSYILHATISILSHWTILMF